MKFFQTLPTKGFINYPIYTNVFITVIASSVSLKLHYNHWEYWVNHKFRE